MESLLYAEAAADLRPRKRQNTLARARAYRRNRRIRRWLRKTRGKGPIPPIGLRCSQCAYDLTGLTHRTCPNAAPASRSGTLSTPPPAPSNRADPSISDLLPRNDFTATIPAQILECTAVSVLLVARSRARAYALPRPYAQALARLASATGTYPTALRTFPACPWHPNHTTHAAVRRVSRPDLPERAGASISSQPLQESFPAIRGKGILRTGVREVRLRRIAPAEARGFSQQQ